MFHGAYPFAVREAEEQEDRGVGEDHVPFQRHRQREGRDDEQVEAHHQQRRGQRHPLVGGEEQDQRSDDLDRGAIDVCHEVRQPRRPHVAPEVAVVGPPHPFGREYRVADHRRNDVGEVLTELREAGADPHHHDQHLQRDDHVRRTAARRRRPAPASTARRGRPGRWSCPADRSAPAARSARSAGPGSPVRMCCPATPLRASRCARPVTAAATARLTSSAR